MIHPTGLTCLLGLMLIVNLLLAPRGRQRQLRLRCWRRRRRRRPVSGADRLRVRLGSGPLHQRSGFVSTDGSGRPEQRCLRKFPGWSTVSGGIAENRWVTIFSFAFDSLFFNIAVNRRAIFLKWKNKTPSLARCYITNDNDTTGIRIGILWIQSLLKTKSECPLGESNPQRCSPQERFVAPLGKWLFWPRSSGF